MKPVPVITTLFLLFSLSFESGCGGNSSNPTPTPTPTPAVVSIGISPSTASSLVNIQTQFTATVTGSSDKSVTWSIQEAAGGAVNGGMYTAPGNVGTYHLVATANADKRKSATATVSVSAKFAFMEHVAGSVMPNVMFIPMIGTYGPDGKLTIAAVNDPNTNAPMSITNMEWLSLSPDGTKIAFDTETDTSNCCAYNIYVVNSDGTGLKQLTTNDQSWYPMFSPDGKQILGIHEGAGPEIGVMNADGSNQHIVFSAGDNSAEVWSAAWSPDGTKIVSAMDWGPGGVTDGIVMMNADGTNPVVVVSDNGSQGCAGINERPSFTADGKQILFSQFCSVGTMPPIETSVLYAVNLDGTGLTLLHNVAPDTFSYGPSIVAGKVIFQSSEQDSNFEIYSMAPDGNSVTRLTNNAVFDGFDEEYLWWAPNTSSVTGIHAHKRLHGSKK